MAAAAAAAGRLLLLLWLLQSVCLPTAPEACSCQEPANIDTAASIEMRAFLHPWLVDHIPQVSGTAELTVFSGIRW